MNPEDVDEFRKVQEEVMIVAQMAESDFTQPSPKKLFNMYSIIYNAATRSNIDDTEEQYAAAEELYKHFQELLTEVVNRHPIDTRKPRDQVFQQALRKWQHFQIIQRWMLRTFVYISRYYVAHCNKKPLDYVSLNIFYANVFKKVSSTVSAVLLTNIARERRGEEIDKTSMRCAVDMFLKMGFEERLPKMEYVEPLRQATIDFYRKESMAYLNEESAVTYCERAERWLLEEASRAHRFLPDEALQREMMEAVEHEVLMVHAHKLLNAPNSGFVALLEHRRTDEIQRMYQLMSRLKHKGIDPMADILGQHCRSEGMALVRRYSNRQGEPDFKNYIAEFIDLHERYLLLLQQSLGGHPAFQACIKDAFEATVNQGISVVEAQPPAQQSSASSASPPQTFKVSSAELLSNYVDVLVKNSQDKLTDDELDDQFTQIVSLFTRIVDKDLFQEFMRSHLSRRLLSNNPNLELEKALILKFKHKCGSSFTSRFEGMINDKAFSHELHLAFREHVAEEGSAGQRAALEICAQNGQPSMKCDFSAQVLTMGFWPTFTVDKMLAPRLAQDFMELFTTFYMTRGKYSHRVLRWVHSLGNVTLTAQLPGGNKEFQMSVYQAAVLYLFNDSERHSLADVERLTGLEAEQVRLVVQSYTQSKIRLMFRSDSAAAATASPPVPATTPMRPTDVLTLNLGFTAPQKKLKIPVAVQRVTAAQTAQVAAQVDEDRRPAIDACIVRVMKSRKTMDHTNLVAEVIGQLSQRFKPEPKLIKQRIEDLINREYIERQPGANSVYLYNAN